MAKLQAEQTQREAELLKKQRLAELELANLRERFNRANDDGISSNLTGESRSSVRSRARQIDREEKHRQELARLQQRAEDQVKAATARAAAEAQTKIDKIKLEEAARIKSVRLEAEFRAQERDNEVLRLKKELEVHQDLTRRMHEEKAAREERDRNVPKQTMPAASSKDIPKIKCDHCGFASHSTDRCPLKDAFHDAQEEEDKTTGPGFTEDNDPWNTAEARRAKEKLKRERLFEES